MLKVTPAQSHISPSMLQYAKVNRSLLGGQAENGGSARSAWSKSLPSPSHLRRLGSSARQLSNLALGSFKPLEASLDPGRSPKGGFAVRGREPLSASPLHSTTVAAAVGLTSAVSLPTKSGAGSFDQSALAFVLVAEVSVCVTMHLLIGFR